MRERIEKILEELKEINERIGRKNRRMIILIAIVAALVIALGVHFAGQVSYEVLYTNLSSDEQVEILGVIEGLGIQSQSDNNGTIRVPSGQADSVRAQLALQGYPKSGLSYGVFTNNVSITSTDFEKETYKIYELQDRLAATIRCFEGVRDATVTIAVSKSNDYVLKSSDDKDDVTTASVTVIMNSGGSPEANQVTGIQKLVASSVPGMLPENVAVIDGMGNEVSGSQESSIGDSNTLSDLKLQLEQTAEQSIKAKVLNLLEPVYGTDHIRVSVNCTVDIDKKVSELLTYYPSESGDNSGVKSHESLNWENIGNGTEAKGVVGTESNSEVPVYPYTSDNDLGDYYVDSREYDYLVSQLTEQVQKDAGEITDTHVSVVIDSGSLSANEIQEIKDLVGVTASIAATERDEKVAVMDTRFATTEPQQVVQTVLNQVLSIGPLLYIIIAAIVVLFIILISVMAIMRSRKKKRAAQAAFLEPEDEEEEVEWDVETITLDDIEETREQILRNQIREFAAQNPEIAANLIKTWLRNEEEI